MRLFHVHRYEKVFAKDKGRLVFSECGKCGKRRVTATSDARDVRVPAGWPKPKHVRSRAKAGSTLNWGSNI